VARCRHPATSSTPRALLRIADDGARRIDCAVNDRICLLVGWGSRLGGQALDQRPRSGRLAHYFTYARDHVRARVRAPAARIDLTCHRRVLHA